MKLFNICANKLSLSLYYDNTTDLEKASLLLTTELFKDGTNLHIILFIYTVYS